MNDEDFWLESSELSLDRIWNNSEDDIYAELLEASMIIGGQNDKHIRRNSQRRARTSARNPRNAR
jgi:hypothetical protein